jgi:hypothetical protein
VGEIREVRVVQREEEGKKGAVGIESLKKLPLMTMRFSVRSLPDRYEAGPIVLILESVWIEFN